MSRSQTIATQKDDVVGAKIWKFLDIIFTPTASEPPHLFRNKRVTNYSNSSW